MKKRKKTVGNSKQKGNPLQQKVKKLRKVNPGKPVINKKVKITPFPVGGNAKKTSVVSCFFQERH